MSLVKIGFLENHYFTFELKKQVARAGCPAVWLTGCLKIGQKLDRVTVFLNLQGSEGRFHHGVCIGGLSLIKTKCFVASVYATDALMHCTQIRKGCFQNQNHLLTETTAL